MTRTIKNRISPFEIGRRLRASGLTPAEKVVVAAILDHARHGLSSCTASLRTLARETGFSERHVARCVKPAEAAGWIVLDRATGSVHSRREIFLGPACYGGKPAEWSNYQEYLASDWWKQRRAKTLKADDYRCRLCGETEGLNVHHRSYERLGAERDSDVITLCRDCHARFHDKPVAAAGEE